jgi:hypothetical protein
MMERLNNIFESILLLEGRKEKARERYPQFSDNIFNYYVENDPSGNQKYLDWLLSSSVAASSSYGNQDKENVIFKGQESGYDPNTFEPLHIPAKYHTDLIKAIKFFHEYQQRFPTYHRDINRFKDLNDLENMVDDVKAEIERSKLKKEAKKEKDVIYEDDRWLVISPKTHRASCVYGAGTKWCITTKGNSQYWSQYTRNATFFFIIDKNRSSEHRLAKVAYRRIGHRDKYELWDAEDREISKTGIGEKWFKELPTQLKENTEKYHRITYEEGEGTDLDELPSEGQALADLLGITDASEIEYLAYDYYGLMVFSADGGEYAVGDDGESDDAHWLWAENYVQEFGPEELDPDGNYIEMSNEEGFIEEEVDYTMEDMSDEDVIEWTSLEDVIINIREKIESEDFGDGETMESLNEKLEELIYTARIDVADQFREEWKSCLRDGVVDCLVNQKGWFTMSGLINSGLVEFDEEGLTNHIVMDGYRADALSSYDGSEDVAEDLEGDTYYIFRIN